jgi:predicted  nucleic acid-binding Zn-ribbon protein
MSTLKNLYELQLVDSQYQENSQRMAEILSELKGTGEVEQAQSQLAEAEEALESLRAEMRAMEQKIGSVNAKLKANQDRLYSGKIRNPKELASLQEEAAALRGYIGDLEEDQLELMIAVEEQEAETTERQARLRQIEATWEATSARLEDEKEQTRGRLETLEQERKGWRDQVGDSDLAIYDDLLTRLGGRAVAPLKRGVCQVCGVDLPTGVARSIERAEGLHFCPTCGRLLYGGG